MLFIHALIDCMEFILARDSLSLSFSVVVALEDVGKLRITFCPNGNLRVFSNFKRNDKNPMIKAWIILIHFSFLFSDKLQFYQL